MTREKSEMAVMPPLTVAFKVPLICVFFFGGETRAVWSNDDLKAQRSSFADSHATVLNCCLKVEPCRSRWCWCAQSPHQAENKTWKLPPLTEILNGCRPIYMLASGLFCAVRNTWLIDKKNHDNKKKNPNRVDSTIRVLNWNKRVVTAGASSHIFLVFN